MGEYQKAEPLYLKVVKIFEKVLGDEHPDTAIIYNNLAGLYQAQGEYQKAEPFHLKALKISEKILGEEHPDTAIIYNNFGQGLLSRHKGGGYSKRAGASLILKKHFKDSGKGYWEKEASPYSHKLIIIWQDSIKHKKSIKGRAFPSKSFKYKRKDTWR